MSDLIDLLERKQLIWQGLHHPKKLELNTSGHPELDEKLGGGLPCHGVIHIQSPIGIGELRLLLPILTQPTEQQKRLLVFINPPGHLHAGFFYHQGFRLEDLLIIHTRKPQESLWASEQCLKSGACHAVLLWHQRFEVQHIQRFQLACEEGRCFQFLMQSAESQQQTSLPVSLSMQLEAEAKGLGVNITKRKGGWPIQRFVLDFSKQWSNLCWQEESTDTRHNIVAFPQTGVQPLR